MVQKQKNDLQLLLKEYGVFLTVADMTSLLKVSRPVVDRLLRSGKLPAAKLGGQYRIRTEDFMKWWDTEVNQTQKEILNCYNNPYI